MPIYEYICKDCDDRFSLLRKVFDFNRKAKCPKCDSKNVKKALSTFASLSGSGTSSPPCGGT